MILSSFTCAGGAAGGRGGEACASRAARSSVTVRTRGGGTDDVDWRAIGVESGLTAGRAARAGGRSWPCSLTNRSMAGDTDDSGDEAGWPPAFPSPDSSGGGAVVGNNWDWAAHGATATHARSVARARIDGRAVILFITNLTPFTVLDSISGMGFPANMALVPRIRAYATSPTSTRSSRRNRFAWSSTRQTTGLTSRAARI